MTSKDKISELHSFIERFKDKLSIVGYLALHHDLEDIEEELEILEFLKEKEYFCLEEFDNGYFLQVGGNPYIKLTKEQYDLFKERLNNSK